MARSRRRRSRLRSSRGVTPSPSLSPRWDAPALSVGLKASRSRLDGRRAIFLGGMGGVPPISAGEPERLRRRPQAYSPTPSAKQTPRTRFRTLSAGLRMGTPSRVWFCLKRKIRREVLFALERAGYRGSGPGRRRPNDDRKYHRTVESSYGC